jgi:tetratricopeptide (TPR) repeat protein
VAVEHNARIDFPPLHRISLTAGRGCGNSSTAAGRLERHVRALERALATPEVARTGVIVAEGDALSAGDVSERLADVLDNLPWEAPVCSLEHSVRRFDELRWGGRLPARHNVCDWVPGGLGDPSAYWISAAYAREVLDRWGSGWRPVSPAGLLDISGALAAVPGLSERRSSAVRTPVTLCMIVRDEADVIGRCLESVRPLIESWVICDTGSTDATIEVVHEALAEIPGELHRRPWRDFGYNRTELMEFAQGGSGYLLLLDADMTLDWRGPLPPLTCDAYMLAHRGEPYYAVPRLVRRDRRWRFEGATHEFLAANEAYSRQLLESLVIDHHADGSSRADKLERDRRLLEQELRSNAGNARAVFYLAQTCRDLGDRRRAVELYRQRAGMSSGDEEAFYAAFQAGALEAEWDGEGAARALLDAWRRRPSRAEPLHELARLRRYQRRYGDACEAARMGLELRLPDDRLFVHRHVYEWGLRFELAVASYWAGDVDLALRLSDELLEAAELPQPIRAAIRDNRAACVSKGAVSSAPSAPVVPRRREARTVPLLGELCPSFDARSLEVDVSPGWPVFNPSIAAEGDGFRVVLRSANYRISDGRYEYLTDDDAIHTINHWVALDRNLMPVSVARIVDRAPGPAAVPVRVRGYEDCRLFRVGQDWKATATVLDRNPVGRCDMALLSFDGPQVTDLKILRGPTPRRHEKNWMPFTVDGRLHVLYSCAPTVVLAIDPLNGAVSEASRRPGIDDARPLRGGSQGVPVSGGLLFVVHEPDAPAGPRVYRHRFVQLDESFELVGITPPFHFLAPQIEFCAGLARRDSQLVFTFGIEDGAAAIATADADEVLGLLRRAG